jgi:hypothetical protein
MPAPRLPRSPNLKPVTDTLWESADADPWFHLTGKFGVGRYVLTFAGRATDGTTPTAMKIYFADDSGGFSERDSIPFRSLSIGSSMVRHTVEFDLPRATRILRFDPAESPGQFELAGLRVKRRTRTARGIKATVALAAAFARSPTRFIHSIVQYAETYAPGDQTGPPPPTPLGVSLPDVVPMNLRAVARLEPKLNVVIPGLVLRGMSGGPNTAVNLTCRMAKAGVPVRYLSSDVEMEKDSAVLWDHFAKVSGIKERLPNVELVTAHDRGVATEIGDRDVFFGTAWWTVQMIKHALPQMRSRQFVYMIQDFEPALYAWSTRFALALETYSMDFYGIINAKTLSDYLFQQKAGRFADPDFSERCVTFEPALDRSIFHPELAPSQKKRLLFYARPAAPRNMYERGIVALRRAVERGAFPANEWELMFIGENLPPVQLGNNVTIRQSPWSGYHEYARLLRSSTVGLSLMLSPHPSYPPLEMGMCGMLAVSTTYATKSAEVLRQYCGNVIAVAPELDAVVDGLMDAFNRSSDVEARRRNAVSILPSTWDDVLDPIVPKAVEFWQKCRASG